MKPVKLYTKDFCGYCVAAKRLLEKKGVAFEEINIQNDPDAVQALFAKTHYRTIPQIFIGDDFIGGFDDLCALEEKGELDQKLA